MKIKKNRVYIDATINGGGHAREILRRSDHKAIVLGIDRDPELIEKIKTEHIRGLIVEKGSHELMGEFIRKNNLRHPYGILFDLGFSSWHIDHSKRGFSFLRNEPLDMRYSQNSGVRAADIINMFPEKKLTQLFFDYGEEVKARSVAREIIRARRKKRITSTTDLAKIVSSIIKNRRKHPATKIFQALRIAVNGELDTLRAGLGVAMSLLAVNGRLLVISYHSIEDRIVKKAFKSQSGLIVTKKPIVPQRSEVMNNPRARSAKLRVWEKQA